jgi:predicted GNAT family N-acyltransferase
MKMKIVNTRDTMSQIYLDSVRIRHQVFVEEQHVPLNMELDEYEALCVNFVIYDENEKALATARLLPVDEEKKMILQRLAVLKEYRKQGLGEMLVQDMENFSLENRYETVELHAQLSAEDFYTKLGYTLIGEIFEEVGIQHITMEKSLL